MSEENRCAVQSAWNAFRFCAERVAEAIERGDPLAAAKWERRGDLLLRTVNAAFRSQAEVTANG